MIHIVKDENLPAPLDEALEKKAHAIVPSGDPQAIGVAKQCLSMDDKSLLDMAGTLESRVQRVEAEAAQAVEEAVGADRLIVNVARAAMLYRITVERNGKKIPSDTYKCEITASKVIDKRISGLLKLFELLPAKDLKDALWVEGVDVTGLDPDIIAQIIKLGAKPVYNSHAGKLRKIAEDCGGEIAEIINANVVDTYGPARLVFEPLPSAEKNVTPVLKAVK